MAADICGCGRPSSHRGVCRYRNAQRIARAIGVDFLPVEPPAVPMPDAVRYLLDRPKRPTVTVADRIRAIRDRKPEPFCP